MGTTDMNLTGRAGGSARGFRASEAGGHVGTRCTTLAPESGIQRTLEGPRPNSR